MTKKEQRIKKLTEYLQRLGAGEELGEVRKDFIKEFSDVQASEIMEAEQELMKQGTPLEEVQRLCDVHAALFHGVTPAGTGTGAGRRASIVYADKGESGTFKTVAAVCWI